MTPEIQTRSLLATKAPSIYELDKHSRQQWWQTSQAFRLIPKKEKDPFKNEALRSIGMFLLLCPIHVAVMLSWSLKIALTQHKEMDLLRMTAMAGLVWLSQIWLFMMAARRHARIVHRVVPVDGGLVFEAPFTRKRVHFFELVDIYPVGNLENGQEFYQVDCNNGDSFLLSKRLSNCDELIGLIDSKISGVVRRRYEVNFRLPNALIDMAITASSVVWIVTAFSIFSKGTMPNAVDFAIFALVSLASLAFLRLQTHKVPQLVRVGECGVYLRTQAQSHYLQWDQVKQVKKFGPFSLLQLRNNWFLILTGTKEPVADKLIAGLKKLELAERRVIS